MLNIHSSIESREQTALLDEALLLSKTVRFAAGILSFPLRV